MNDVDPSVLQKSGLSQEEVAAAMATQSFSEVPVSQFFATDEFVQGAAFYDKDLKPSIPLYSHIFRTGNIDSKTAKMRRLMIMGMFARREALAPDDLFDIEDSMKFEANEMYVQSAVDDSRGGWRFRGLIEQIRTTRLQVQKEGGILNLLRRKRE